jgi:CubicO group peptidase (beta-lactamase class C family)
VVSTPAGIAIAEGLPPGIDTPIGAYLRAEYADVLDAADAAITFRDLLTMSSGFEWNEATTEAYNQWVTSDDPVRYVLTRSLTNPAGTRFTYNSGGVHVLSVALERATGLSTQQLASRYLFSPLGVRAVHWETFPGGQANGGSGIDLRARDLAKLGALWLQHGDAGSGSILPPGWVTEATTSRFPLWQGGAPLSQLGYGYLWWIDHAGNRTHFFAWGFGGQFVWVAPELEMVVGVTTDWRAATVPAGQLATNGIRLIVDHVLPAAR